MSPTMKTGLDMKHRGQIAYHRRGCNTAIGRLSLRFGGTQQTRCSTTGEVQSLYNLLTAPSAPSDNLGINRMFGAINRAIPYHANRFDSSNDTWMTDELNGMEWNGMEWNGREWKGMEGNGREWKGMEGNYIRIGPFHG
jgi:hypothetical protein